MYLGEIIMNIENPVDALEKWFNSMSVSDRDDLAFLTLHSIPTSPLSDSIDLISQNPKELFIDWIQNTKSLSPPKLVGHILTLIVNIDFFVMKNRGTKEEWNSIFQLNESIEANLKQEGHPDNTVEHISKIIREVPFRQKQWKKYAESWELLKSKALSFPMLDAWLSQER